MGKRYTAQTIADYLGVSRQTVYNRSYQIGIRFNGGLGLTEEQAKTFIKAFDRKENPVFCNGTAEDLKELMEGE